MNSSEVDDASPSFLDPAGSNLSRRLRVASRHSSSCTRSRYSDAEPPTSRREMMMDAISLPMLIASPAEMPNDMAGSWKSEMASIKIRMLKIRIIAPREYRVSLAA
jgi:hypothetical protein